MTKGGSRKSVTDKSPYWCPHCFQDTLRPSSLPIVWHIEPPLIDAAEYRRWDCQNPTCAEAWEKTSPHSQYHPNETPPVPWHSARKPDGSSTRDPRYSEPIQPVKGV
jgi:hypothetical protein